jgi:DMSO/TMAO reductase YedYZ heme-binding membrane subunit
MAIRWPVCTPGMDLRGNCGAKKMQISHASPLQTRNPSRLPSSRSRRLAWKGFHSDLRASPIEVITRSTGDWTLIFLLITLSVTPLRMLSRQYWLICLQRMFGMFAFFYGCLHVTTYVWLDQVFDMHGMSADMAKRRF